MTTRAAEPPHPTRLRLLEAALTVIRTKGYAAARVEDVCAEAGLTKGSFFHHFRSKEELAIAAAAHWSEMTGRLFAGAPYHGHEDPLDRVLGYVDFRRSLLEGALPEFTCLVGTMVQEVYATDPAIARACADSIEGHAATLEADIDAARAAYGVHGAWTTRGLALHTQAVLQGAFILAKAEGGPAIAAESVDHLHRYISLLFGRDPARARPPSPATEKESR